MAKRKEQSEQDELARIGTNKQHHAELAAKGLTHVEHNKQAAKEVDEDCEETANGETKDSTDRADLKWTGPI